MIKQFERRPERVALVEPNILLRKAIVDALRSHGFKAIAAAGKLSLLDAVFKEEPADIVITATEAEDGCGVETIRNLRLKGGRPGRDAVAIAMVDSGNCDPIGQAVDAGFDAVLLKPVAMGELIKRIEAALIKRKNGHGPMPNRIRTANSSAAPAPKEPLAQVRIDRTYNSVCDMVCDLHAAAQVANGDVWEQDFLAGRLIDLAQTLEGMLKNAGLEYPASLTATLIDVAMDYQNAGPAKSDGTGETAFMRDLCETLGRALERHRLPPAVSSTSGRVDTPGGKAAA